MRFAAFPTNGFFSGSVSVMSVQDGDDLRGPFRVDGGPKELWEIWRGERRVVSWISEWTALAGTAQEARDLGRRLALAAEVMLR